MLVGRHSMEAQVPTVFGVKELGGRRGNEEERAYLG